MCVALMLLSFTSSGHVAHAQRQLLACSLILLWFIVLFFLLSTIMRLVSENKF
jgi:ABC-type phosphate transport system permease subunit